MPHREAAWAMLSERLDEAAALCEAIAVRWGSDRRVPCAGIRVRPGRPGPPPAGQLPYLPRARPPAVPPLRPASRFRGSCQRPRPGRHRAAARAPGRRLRVPPSRAGARRRSPVTPARNGPLAARLYASVLRPLASDLPPPHRQPLPEPRARGRPAGPSGWPRTGHPARARAGRRSLPPPGLARGDGCAAGPRLQLARGAAAGQPGWPPSRDLQRGLRPVIRSRKTAPTW